MVTFKPTTPISLLLRYALRNALFIYDGSISTVQGLITDVVINFLYWAPRHEGILGEWRCSSTHSLTSVPDGGERSSSHPPAALPPGKEPLVPIGQKTGLAPEPFWRRWSEIFKRVSVNNEGKTWLLHSGSQLTCHWDRLPPPPKKKKKSFLQKAESSFSSSLQGIGTQVFSIFMYSLLRSRWTYLQP